MHGQSKLLIVERKRKANRPSKERAPVIRWQADMTVAHQRELCRVCVCVELFSPVL